MDKGGFVGKAMFAYRYSHRPAVWMRRLTRAGFLSADAHRPGGSRRRGEEGQVKGGGLEEQRGQETESDLAREERRRVRSRRTLRLKAALLGRSRGGWTSKIRLAADRKCRPLAFILTAGQAADIPRFVPVLKKVRLRARRPPPHPAGRSRRRQGLLVSWQPCPLANAVSTRSSWRRWTRPPTGRRRAVEVAGPSVTSGPLDRNRIRSLRCHGRREWRSARRFLCTWRGPRSLRAGTGNWYSGRNDPSATTATRSVSWSPPAGTGELSPYDRVAMSPDGADGRQAKPACPWVGSPSGHCRINNVCSDAVRTDIREGIS